MFGTQHEYYLLIERFVANSNSDLLNSISSSKRKHIMTGVAGCLAGLTEASLTPFERVQAVLQMQKFHDSYQNTLHVFRDITKNHGFKELYRGLSAICLRNSMSNLLFFTTRQPLKATFPETKSKFRNALYDFLNGGILGACISTLFYPLNIIKSHMQARVGGEFAGIWATFRSVFEARDRKLGLLFKGVGSNFMRAVLAWGFTNSSYELVLNAIQKF